MPLYIGKHFGPPGILIFCPIPLSYSLWGFFIFLLYVMRRVDCRRCGAGDTGRKVGPETCRFVGKPPNDISRAAHSQAHSEERTGWPADDAALPYILTEPEAAADVSVAGIDRDGRWQTIGGRKPIGRRLVILDAEVNGGPRPSGGNHHVQLPQADEAGREAEEADRETLPIVGHDADRRRGGRRRLSRRGYARR